MAGPWEQYAPTVAPVQTESGPWAAYGPAPSQPEYNVTPGDGTNPTRIAPAEPRQVGVAEAVGRGAAKGITFNFNDELRGLVEASGANPDDPASIYNLVSGAIKYWSGNKDAGQRYDAATKRERAADKAAEDQRPYTSLAGNVAGAVALPVGGMLQAATLPGRMAAGAGVGAVTGAAYGAGEGSGAGDRLTRAASGAAIGGAVGGVAPAAIEGIVRAGQGIARSAEPLTNAYRGFRDPEGEAARRVTSSIARDYRAGDPGLTGAEFRAARNAGQPVAVMDLGGETTRALARSSANTSPEGRGILSRAIDDRFEGQGGRVTDWLNGTFHYPNAHAQQQAIDQVERTVNRAGYARAYEAGDRDINSRTLERLLGAPAVADALRSAIERGQNRAVVQGFGAFNPPAVIENGIVRFNRRPNGVAASPNLQLWDYTYRELRDAGQAAFRAGRNEEGGALNNLAQTLRQELDNIVPEYGAARGAAASFFRAENALEAGQNFVAQNFGNREARQALSRMSQNERQLFQDGFVSRLIETIDKVGDRRNVVGQIFNSPAAREKIEIAVGRQRTAELEAFLRVEGLMDLARGAVQGNSTTARQLIEAGLAGGAGYGVATGDWSPQSVFTAAFVGGVARGAASRANQRIDQNVARRVAEMLTSNDPRVLQRGMRIVATQPRFLENLRRADNAVARVSAEQSTGVPALQAAGVGRAEDQPSIPRPPGQ